MKKLALIVLVFLTSLLPSAHADIFGGDDAILANILVQTIEELAQLKSILQNADDSLNLMRDINRGINDSLGLARTISPNKDPGLYREWLNVQSALNSIEAIYGVSVQSRDNRVQTDADQSVAEAISLNNSIYQYTNQIDDIGESIKEQSHSVSPGGASKLTAESLGVMLNLQNQMLRTQATGLKLQAQALALQNRKDKDRTRQMVEGADRLNSALANYDPQFTLPRF